MRVDLTLNKNEWPRKLSGWPEIGNALDLCDLSSRSLSE